MSPTGGHRSAVIRWRRSLWVGTLAVALALVSLPTGAAAQESLTCAEPVAAYRYEPEAFVYTLSIDLSGCAWWKGSSIVLQAAASRLDATGEEGSVAGVVCFRAAPSGAPEPRATTCEVSASVARLPLEVARYRGLITYPWEDGERRQQVELDCTSVPGLTSLSGCQPALVPLG